MKRGIRLAHKAEDDRSMKSTVEDLERIERKTGEETFNKGTEPINPLMEGLGPLSGAEGHGTGQGAVDAREERRQRELLEDALAMAQYASNAKSVFLTNMSHDFRTPMNAIMSFTDIALDHLDDGERVEDCLQKIRQSSHHLLNLLNDVLDVSRIESGKLRLNEQPLDLFTLAGELTEMFQGEVEKRSLDFTLDFSAVRHSHIYGDNLRLSQVFINLIGNAVKFTEPGGTVMVKADPETRLAADYCLYTFTVSDTGCGMSSAFIDHIFEPFERDRIDAVAKTVGTGLGMTITKNLIDMMGGSIEVASELGQGSQFTISIPLKLMRDGGDDANDPMLDPTMAKRDDPGVTGDAVGKSLAGKRALVVDDDELSREILRELLVERGVRVTEADNGEQAVMRFQNAREGSFDFILMDVHMPVLDGLEATRMIRALPRKDSKTVPIIATTACAFDEDRKKAVEAGMTDHISKPLDMNRLYRLLAEVTA